MRWMLVGLIALLITTDFTGVNPGLGPGLSVKNAMLYLLVMVLAFRMALTGGLRLRMPAMHLAWAAWVGYAVITWMAVSLVLKYTSYEPLASAMALKSELIDCALYCFVAFYIVQSEDDFRFVLHALVGVVGISSILTLTDLVGITSLGLKVGESGAEADRVFGAFGHANETGSFLACMLPPLVATVMSSRGFWRLFWLGSTAATAAVFILTVSRGAYVGVLLGFPIAAYLLRGLIPPGRIVTWAFGVVGMVLVGGIIAAFFNPASIAAIGHRFFDFGTNAGTMGLSQASSGRTDIWGMAIREMMNSPLSFLTGFGWNAWSTMPTIYVLHNQYLDQWFNLGVVGLVTYIGLEYMTIANAKRAAALSSTGPMQWDMIACVFGVMALSIAIIFENMFTPRPYMWMYTGLILRGAVIVYDKAAARAEVPAVAAPAVAVGGAWRRA